jgi:hypothetical protein
MKVYRGLELYFHHSWTRYQVKASGQLHAAFVLLLGESALVINCVGSRDFLHTVEKSEILPLPKIEPQT